MTLIELAIVLVILPLIIGAVTYALVVTFTSSNGVSSKLSASVDSQVTDTFYVRDVQSAQYVTTTKSPTITPWTTAGLTHCGSGKTFVAGLAWASGTPSEETVVSYWSNQTAGGSGTISSSEPKVLNVTSLSTGRLDNADLSEGLIQLGASGVIQEGTTVGSVTLLHDLLTLSKPAKVSGTSVGISFAIGPQLVREFCRGPGSGSHPSRVTTSHDFFSPFTQAVVTCVANVTAPKCHTTSASQGTVAHRWVTTLGVSGITLAVTEPAGHYDYNLSAAPRVANALGSQFSAGCQGTGCFAELPTLLALGGFQVITERAHAHITVIGTAVINHGWLTMSNMTTFTATGKIETTDTPATDICHLTATAAKHRSCTGTPLNPSPVHISSPVTDPFQGLVDPTPEPVKTCPAGSATISPGQYRCTLSISGSGDTVTLSPGVYEFDTGIAIGGNGALKATSDVLIYLPCNVAGAGHNVDTWATQCNEGIVDNNGSVSAARLLAGPYAGLWLWENKGDSAGIGFTGHGALSAEGILYAPDGSVTLNGQATTTSVGAIVAKTFSVTNSSIRVTG